MRSPLVRGICTLTAVVKTGTIGTPAEYIVVRGKSVVLEMPPEEGVFDNVRLEAVVLELFALAVLF